MITVISTDPLVGADTEGLYDGTWVEVSYEDLTVTTVETEDGFDRVTAYGDFVVAKGNTSREGFVEAFLSPFKPGDEQPTEEMIEEAWQKEMAITSHSKLLVQAVIDGELTTIERKLRVIDWVAR